MDWDRIETAVDALMRTVQRFGYPVDSESLLALANEGDTRWRTDPEALRNQYRALDLMDLLQLVDKPDGLNRQISDSGRQLLQTTPLVHGWIDRDDHRVQVWSEMEMLREAAQDARPLAENTFARLEISSWRQFQAIDISFHPRLTIITGANGAGKTTLLNILAPHLSWSAQLVSSGRQEAGGDLNGHTSEVGRLFYTNGARTSIVETLAEGVHISALQMPSQQHVPGLFISSHRSISSYQQLQNLPARFSAANVLLNQFAGEVQTRYSGGSSQYPPLFRMKEALVAAAMHGYGNQAVLPTEEARIIWEGFQDVLRNFLPKSLRFRELAVKNGDVIVRTHSAEFPLEAVSGGLSAMLELAWQVFLRSRDAEAFTVCIDEPENHLHPELQRQIVPALLDAFPHVSFIIATHSPFVVTAFPDAYVYALSSNFSGVVTSRRVHDLNSSGTSDDTLMSVLGLDTPLPIWAEGRLKLALEALPPDPSVDELRDFRDKLVAAGLEEQFSAALDILRVDSTRDSDKQ
ncbi:AAA family ATPase [Curtobacterium sp. YR515]|uniref:AAA family ATPase n=1 Tax=Curtobacterium sp. YR515 TaxID=1855316 RepID=UPI001587608D|nr:AAA family ATPase [Curtobacterium sp. YR515]